MAEYPAIDIWRYMLSEGVSVEYIKECHIQNGILFWDTKWDTKCNFFILIQD